MKCFIASLFKKATRKTICFNSLPNKEARQYFDGINTLYGVEYPAVESDELGSQNYLKLRQFQSEEILEKMKTKLERDIGNNPPKSPFGKALTYLNNHWDSLQVFLTDPKIKLDSEAYALGV